jgi:HEXXH motif-containing protein
MRTPYSWMPDDTAAARDQRKLASRTSLAIRALVRDTAPRQASVVTRVLTQLRTTGQVCHPDVFHWYFQLRNQRAQEEQLDQVTMLPLLVQESRQRAAASQREFGLNVDTAPMGPGVVEALRRGAEYARPLAGQDVHLEPIASWTPEMKRRITDALALLRAVWPEACDELPRFVRRFIVYQGHAVIGFTDFRYHGSIFFKYEWLMGREHTEEVAEDLLHEAAHVRLNALMGTTPLFQNDDQEIYPSPLRRDLRSMYGVWHQMYVLRRVVELYQRLQERSLLRHAANLAETCEGFDQAYKVVKEHANLTRAGRAMLRTMADCAA